MNGMGSGRVAPGVKWLAFVCLVGVARADRAPSDMTPSDLAGPPPLVAAKLPSGVQWSTILAGHGAHPAATDWVVYYGGGKYESRESYYMPRVAQANNVFSFDVTSMAVGETRRFWSPASGPTSANVVDIQLVAILGAEPPNQMALFPAPNDARTGAHGDRFVTIYAGKPNGVHPGIADKVHFDVSALDKDVNRVDVGLPQDMPTLADVRVPALADAIRDMDPGEMRYVWARHDGKPLFMRVTLYSVEKRVQVAAPPGIAQAPLSAKTADGVQFVVLAPGGGDPIDIADEVTLDYVVWSPTGRTIEMSPSITQLARDFVFRDQLTDMRLGEHRRIWMSPKAANYYSEVGRGAIADIKVVGLHRKIEPLPNGLRIVHQRDIVEVVRGATHAALPLGIVTLEGVTLANGIVTFSGTEENEQPVSATMSLAQLEARLDDVESKEALHAGRIDDAVASATKALAGAPELDELYFDLARAYVAGGKPHDAARVFAPLAARNPVGVYVQIHEDDKLAKLAAEPEIAKLRVKTPARVDLDKQPLLVDRAGRFVAVQLDEGSWGSGDSETRIEIIELATGNIVETIRAVAWSYMSQPMTPQIEADVAKRKKLVASWLGDLGFAAPKNLDRGVIDTSTVSRGDPVKVTFAKSKIVIDEDGTVRSGKQVLGSAPGVSTFNHGTFWLPHERAMIFIEGRPGRECCDSTDPVWAVVKKL
jgi:hypothetical protein